MEQELWKVIPDFINYEISSLGRIRSKDKVIHRTTYDMKMKGRILKPSDNGRGYKKIQLKQDGRTKKYYIHRLVAQAFIPNPYNKPFINHIDNNPNNNNVNNLEWCTPQENTDWMAIQGRNKRTEQWKSRLKKSLPHKPVIATNIDTEETIFFEGINDTREKGFTPSSVCQCCKGERKTHKGYRWEYA